MTTKHVVADGESNIYPRGLVQVKANELVARIINRSLELDVVLEGMQLLIEGLDIKGEMVYTPLEWSDDLGESDDRMLLKKIEIYKGDEWRLPTVKELDRALRAMKPKGFLVRVYYWTSTAWTGVEGGMEVLMSYGFDNALNGCSSNKDCFKSGRNSPRLRLCRPKKLD